MATFKGTVKKNDLEGGFLELHADDGKKYQLKGGDPKVVKDGAKVARGLNACHPRDRSYQLMDAARRFC